MNVGGPGSAIRVIVSSTGNSVPFSAHAGQLEPPVEHDRALGLEEARQPAPVRCRAARAARSARPSPGRSPRPPSSRRSPRRRGSSRSRARGASIVTTASSAASSIARSRDSLARTSSSAWRRATYCPTWLPSTRIVASSRSSGSRSSRVKNSITPRRPAGCAAGSRTPRAGRRAGPRRRGGSSRPAGASTIHAGSPLASTRPGRPSPGASASSLAERLELRRVRSPACQVRMQRRRPSSGSSSHTAPSSQPSELPDRLQRRLVHLDRPVGFARGSARRRARRAGGRGVGDPSAVDSPRRLAMASR